MTLTAYINGQKVFASSMNDRKLNYLDDSEPTQKMILVKGKVKIDHFRHYPGEFSLYEMERDTEEHDKGKHFIYTLFKLKNQQTDVEVINKDINRRGDVVVPEQKLNIEFQCASISIDEIENRTLDWKSIDYRTLWIFGTKNYFKQVWTNAYRLKSPELYCLEKNGCIFYSDGINIIQRFFRNSYRYVNNEWEGNSYWKKYVRIKELYGYKEIKSGNKYKMEA